MSTTKFTMALAALVGWPRFMCTRDGAGNIVEERQFARPEAVPEGWEFISPPVNAASAGQGEDIAQLRADLNAARMAAAQATQAAAQATAANADLIEFVGKATDFAAKVADSGAPDDVKAEAAAIVAGSSLTKSSTEAPAAGKTAGKPKK